MAFPDTPIDLLAEMQVGETWTDFTGDLYARGPLTIERGRPDEAARVDPSRATFQLDNRQNKYSPRNPRSANYGLIGRNTPVRVSIPGSESYLEMPGVSGDIVSTPDHASLDITGDLDVRVELTADWYQTAHQVLIGKWSTVDGNRSWIWRIKDGISTFVWSPTGLTSGQIITAATLPALPRRAALRVVLDVNNGSGGNSLLTYYSDSLDGAWTLIRDDTASGLTSIFSGSAPLEIAPTQVVTGQADRPPFRGRLHRAEVRSGIAGTVVASPDVRALTPGTTSWADSAGRTWTIAGTAEISNREYRLHAEVSSWPARWDESGRDVYVPVEASGILRRLGQGGKVLASTLRRRIPSFGPVAYWPLEEGSDATQAYSPLPGVSPLAVTGFTFAADDTCPGSLPLPKIAAGATMIGSVPAYSPTGEWLVACQYLMETYPSSAATMLDITTTGTMARLVLTLDPGAVELRGYNSSGVEIMYATAPIDGVSGPEWRRLDLAAIDEGGGNCHYHVGWVTTLGGFALDTTVTASPGIVTGLATTFGADLADMRIGHLSVLPDSATDVYISADAGYNGETTCARLGRLGVEESVPVRLDTPPSQSARLGPQQPNPLLTLLGEGADADGGILYEDRSWLALRYRGRSGLYNQPIALTLDYSAEGEIAPPLEPTDDDQRVRNDRTVSRRSGSSARAVDETGPLSTQAPPTGVGIYDDEITLNLYSDSQPEDIAGWRLHLGTWDEGRYPTVHIDLAAAPHLIPDVVALEIGDRIQIINPPNWLPPGPIDLLVEGYTETIAHPNGWDVVLNCSPAGPWSVAVADDVVLGRAADSGVSTLASGIDATTTSLSIATASGPLWNTADEPYDIEIGGEVMTVTALTGSASPQSATVTRSVNGVVKSHSSGASVSLAQSAITSY